MNRLIAAQWLTILVAIVLGAIAGPLGAIGIGLLAGLIVIVLGMGRDGLWRLP